MSAPVAPAIAIARAARYTFEPTGRGGAAIAERR